MTGARGWGAALLLGALLRPGAGSAQPTRPAAAGPPAALYATYRYVAYTVYDHTDGDPPTRVAGVGGTLTLFPTGAYDKRLRITGPNGARDFVQHGQCTVSGDSIRFAFTDAQGFDVQRGTYSYDARARRLTVVIAGYPPGNRGVYELVAATAASGPRPTPSGGSGPGPRAGLAWLPWLGGPPPGGVPCALVRGPIPTLGPNC